MFTKTPEVELGDLTKTVAETAVIDVIPGRTSGWGNSVPWLKLRDEDFSGNNTNRLESAILLSPLANRREVAERALSTVIEGVLTRSVAAASSDWAKKMLQITLDEFRQGKECLVYLHTLVPQPGGQIIPPRWRGIPLDLRKPANSI